MPSTSQTNPRLIVISDGPLCGRAYDLRQGDQLLGRKDDADVAIPAASISGKHAYLAWDGREVQIADAGSRNGTTVNGRAVGEGVRLRHGDVLGLGDVELRLEMQSDQATAEVPAVRYDNQFGPNHGTIQQAGRDIHALSWHEHRYDQDEPIDELFQGRGPGRLLLAVGMVIAFAGFGLWMYLIVSFGATMSGGNPQTPFEREFLGLPAGVVGFGGFLVGGILAGLGSSMSKAARQRETSRFGAAPRHYGTPN